jgi:hypothetical protein
MTRELAMPAFSSELVKVMRSALEEVMRKVPQEHASSAIKAHLAGAILIAAAQGHATQKVFMHLAENELPAILSLLQPVGAAAEAIASLNSLNRAGGSIAELGQCNRKGEAQRPNHHANMMASTGKMWIAKPLWHNSRLRAV